MMKTIWLFREKRSGGTAFTTILSSKLNRPIHFIDPNIITKRDLTIVHRMYVENQKLWDEYSKLYPSCTIYYEDLCEGIDIPLLELTDCKLSNNLEIKKLPDYKQRVFLNYDMLVKWTQELLDEDFG